MKKRNMILQALLVSVVLGSTAAAAVPDSEVTRSYDSAVDLQDNQDSLDVTVNETTIVPDIKENAGKTIHLQVSGLQDLKNLKAAISIETDDGTKEQYYTDGYFYDNDSGKNIKYAMKPEEMLQIMNQYVYLNLNSEYLDSLDYNNDSYLFTATEKSLGEFTDNILEGVQDEHQTSLMTLQGYINTDSQGQITKRRIQTVYTVRSGEEPQTCTTNSVSTFADPGKAVIVALPDLSSYKESKANKPVVQITEKNATVYATADLNVRAQNNVSAAVLGGIAAGGTITQTGYTSDGWIQIDYQGTTAYVSADFVSEKKPVIVKSMSGTMYATTEVYVRNTAGTDGAILGSLSTGNTVSVSGYTNNNWIRITYNGHTGYVSSDYLSWNAPVTAMGGTMYVTNVQANVRSYYSTDADVLGTLGYGDDVTVTGYTPNNWIRISYKGYTGYVYGDLLSWTDPLDYSDVSFEEDDQNSGSSSNPADTSSVKQVYGTIMSSGMSTITVSCNNGKILNLAKEDGEINCPNGIYNGLYVSVVYYHDSASGANILQALDAM
ncbi:SH3 domain-containing protein [Jingyaoa shaoxingensis]|uniref:SH3 domain-containing protein n=1 Tax=Jingyaoa shaoxingensis TaxID=2763671 RepID=A0ABR7NDR4_9FIRM|nr:SH3 domain-containing protein [Jingyaoa shaoxingensis]MBC8574515.1 SH3 domain-containing protein [Jingyaoa shaoxingensis]